MARIAVVGAGWAGLAAAVQATALGHTVAVYEMAPQCGGRGRTVKAGGLLLDNGQHIMIGAYSETLRLLRLVRADAQQVLLRTPLSLIEPSGLGLRLPTGSPMLAFLRAVARHPGWPWRAKLALASICIRWWRAGFVCAPDLSVARLCAGMPRAIQQELIDPLCVAALNTRSDEASARVFLRVLRDALTSGPGCSDLLLPRVPLGDVFPQPAVQWLKAHGATVHLCARVQAIEFFSGAWSVEGAMFQGVVLATSPHEAARLTSKVAPTWAARALELPFEPIVTVYLRCPGTRLAFPMLRLRDGPQEPAQFVFDRGQLGGPEGLLAFVISGAGPWIERGGERILAATITQARNSLGSALFAPPEPVQVLMEKRATFRCTPALERPAAKLSATLWAAGDYVDGPYPATLESAVRSGVDAANQIAAAV